MKMVYVFYKLRNPARTHLDVLLVNKINTEEGTVAIAHVSQQYSAGSRKVKTTSVQLLTDKLIS
jgi:hypothetical protein